MNGADWRLYRHTFNDWGWLDIILPYIQWLGLTGHYIAIHSMTGADWTLYRHTFNDWGWLDIILPCIQWMGLTRDYIAIHSMTGADWTLYRHTFNDWGWLDIILPYIQWMGLTGDYIGCDHEYTKMEWLIGADWTLSWLHLHRWLVLTDYYIYIISTWNTMYFVNWPLSWI